MKESYWKGFSLLVTTALIVVVTSWATAQSTRDEAAQTSSSDDEVAESGNIGRVVVEANKERYVLRIGHASSSENDKYILFDSWDVANTKDIWFLKDPHNTRSEWVRIKFDEKSKR
jgi:hypothetical protein